MQLVICLLLINKGHIDLEALALRKGACTYPGHTGSCMDLPSKAIKAGVHGIPGGENMIRLSKWFSQVFYDF